MGALDFVFRGTVTFLAISTVVLSANLVYMGATRYKVISQRKHDIEAKREADRQNRQAELSAKKENH
ncbi:hypothetical protein PROFUN_00806 [Planoprotostelium fungivorum]|uniref:Uncharacterized protein n=1 Tax=Planoprotostelium fungivorum TaxID=1890364 RepID=A0A2P6P011_9EUKA|nr:hypothetical protein PROFUN_00806 [Planoprotostelium fungivorum]